jgi:hypothetical protein
LTIKDHFSSYINFPECNIQVKKYIEGFYADNMEVLSSDGFSKPLVFGEMRRQSMLDLYGYDDAGFRELKKTNVVLKKGFIQINDQLNILLCLSSGVAVKEDLKLFFLNFLCLKVFTSKYNRQFPYGVNSARMLSAIGKLSNRYDIKIRGNLFAAVNEQAKTIYKKFQSKYNKMDDDFILELINRVSTSMSSFVKNIATVYYDEKNYELSSEENLDKDNFILTTNDTVIYDSVKNNMRNDYSRNGLNLEILKQCNLQKHTDTFKNISNDKESMDNINKLVDLYIDDYIKNAKDSSVLTAVKKYGFMNHYKSSLKIDRELIRTRDAIADKYGNTVIEKKELSKAIDRYLLISIHRELQKRT